MFTFLSFNLLLAFVAGLILIAGLTILTLRRRNEILQEFLTPAEPDIEKEFFKRRAREVAEKQPVLEEAEPESVEPTPAEEGWGDAAQ